MCRQVIEGLMSCRAVRGRPGWLVGATGWLVLLVVVTAAGACTVDQQLTDQLVESWTQHISDMAAPFHYSFLLAKPFLELSLNASRVYQGNAFDCPMTSGCNPYVDPTCTTCVPALQQEYRPDAPSQDPDAPLRLRSHCPWTYYQTDNKVKRFPFQLWEARCLPDETNPDNMYTCLGQAAGPGRACQPVTFPVPILVNTGTAGPDGRCLYKPIMYRLQVGCTCATVPVVN